MQTENNPNINRSSNYINLENKGNDSTQPKIINRSDIPPSNQANSEEEGQSWISRVIASLGIRKREKTTVGEPSISRDTIEGEYEDKLKKLEDTQYINLPGQTGQEKINAIENKAKLAVELDGWLNVLSDGKYDNDDLIHNIKEEMKFRLEKWATNELKKVDLFISKDPMVEKSWESKAKVYKVLNNGFYEENVLAKVSNPKLQELQAKIHQANFKSLLYEDGKLPTLSPDSKSENREKIATAIKRDFVNFNLNSILIIPFKYDGIPPYQALFSFVHDYKKFAEKNENINNPGIKANINILQNAYNILLDINSIKAMKYENQCPDDEIKKIEGVLNDKILNQVQNLKVGEKILIPGGTSYHVFVYEFTRVDANKLEFKVINLGIGVSNHNSPSILPSLNPNAKIQTYIIKDIEQNAVTSEFIGKLIGAQLETKYHYLKMITDQFNPNSGTNKIYRTIKANLIDVEAGGKKVKLKEGEEKYIHKEQNQNSCAKKAYSCWLRENLSSQDMRNFKVEATKASLERLREVKKYEDSKRTEGWFSEVSKWFRQLTSPIARIGMALTNQFPTDSIVKLGEKIEKKRTHKAKKSQPSNPIT